MPQKLALKRLTASDLTFFEWHFAHHNAGNQKAINLNANIFIDELYPSLPDIAQKQGGRIPLDLYIYGPGFAGEYNLQRKIIKHGTYKNWRLNGETISKPDELERFNILAPGDFAVFDFTGDLFPHSAKVVFVSHALDEDRLLHSILDGLLNNQKMRALTPQSLVQAIQSATVAGEHPIYDLVLDSDLEDAAQGGIKGIRRLQSRASRRRISSEALQQARENANRVGLTGEEFVSSYLSTLFQEGVIQGFEWVSNDNAVSPYDFRVLRDGRELLVEVKSTETSFDNSLHISYNELLQMRETTAQYDLYRVYEIVGPVAQVRIAENMQDFAVKMLEVLESLPEGVKADSISVSPAILPFQNPVTIYLTSEEE